MGVRLLSAILKRAGYETVVIFVHGAVSREVAMGRARVFDDSIHDAIAELAAGSLITPTYHATRELTLRMGARSGAPIIWGGVHPIVRPDECLEYADMICVGEGEGLVVELADRLRKRRAYDDTPGLRVRNGPPTMPAPPVDLSRIPIPEYAVDGSHYLVYARGKGLHEIMRIAGARAYN